jgi:hypothetical protein
VPLTHVLVYASQAFPTVVLQYGKSSQQQQPQQLQVPHAQYGATSSTGSNSHSNGQTNSANAQLVADLVANATAASTATAATSKGKIGSGSNKQVTFGPMPLPLPQQPPVKLPSSTVQSGPDNQTEAEVTCHLLTTVI